jgi:hypothetical protein
MELHKYSVSVAAIQETGWNVREAQAVIDWSTRFRTIR